MGNLGAAASQAGSTKAPQNAGLMQPLVCGCHAKRRTDRGHSAGDVLFNLPHCGWPARRVWKTTLCRRGRSNDGRRCLRTPAPVLFYR